MYEQRLYPESVPPFEGEANPAYFFIKNLGKSMGEGLVTRIFIPKGAVAFRFNGPVLNYQTLFTLQQAPGVYIEDPYVMGKVLHSCHPNLTCDMSTCTFTALRDIQPGEVLTMNYEETEDELFREFDCQCGNEGCRGRISGRLRH